LIRVQELDRSDFVQAREADEEDQGTRAADLSSVYYYGRRMFRADGTEGKPRAEILKAVRKFADPKLQS